MSDWASYSMSSLGGKLLSVEKEPGIAEHEIGDNIGAEEYSRISRTLK